MASRNTYECYACKKAGFPNIRVYLDGKTESGQTIYKDEDLTPHQHQHKQQSQSQQPQAQQVEVTNADLVLQIKLLQQKMDSILELLTAKVNQG
ncbi:MAG: hypothetical protein ACRD4B_01440 [Acidobacteriota bacterium]